MKNSILLYGLLLTLMSGFVLVSCDDDDDDIDTGQQNVVEFAQNDPQFSMLVAALEKTNLDDVLATTSPLTVFAPTNAAFESFLQSAGTNTIEDTPVDVLAPVLTGHVVAGEFTSANLNTGYYATLNAPDFDAQINSLAFIDTDNGVTINGQASVTAADVDVSNGVIHVIDAVIPASTVVDFATADENFSTLVAALTREDLSTDFVSILSGEGPFTVFAPTNQAFQNLLNSNGDWNTLDDIPAQTLETVLSYHVTDAGNVRAGDLSNGQTVNTLAGESFTIDLTGQNPMIDAIGNTATIITTDVQSQNGVIHVVDTVLLPIQ